MYRTNDPRFKKRLNDLTQTLESANETAQSSLYIFGQSYLKPCFHSLGACFSQCYAASCPGLQRDRERRRRNRADLNFDFYDDWEEEENDGLLGGWGEEDLSGGYGTIGERGMVYGSGKRGRRKSLVLPKDGGALDPGTGSSKGVLGRLFGGKQVRYKPSAAGLQEHPGARRLQTEGEALLEEHEEGGRSRTHRRARSGTVESRDTSDSYSSRGDLFPSDEEDDAVPLDDEFAMVLERRNTQSGPETESISTGTGSSGRRRGKRPSAGSRTSTRRSHSAKDNRSRASSKSFEETPVLEEDDTPGPSLTELKQEEQRIEQLEEAEIEHRRQEAQRLATERGLAEEALLSSKEATPRNTSPTLAPVSRAEEPSQLPTPLDTEDEEEETTQDLSHPKEPHDDTQPPPDPTS